MTTARKNWLHVVEGVIRSRHYTWLPEGLGGEPVDVAMTYLLTDIMHICKRTDASFEKVLEASRQQFRKEELQNHPPAQEGKENARPHLQED